MTGRHERQGAQIDPSELAAGAFDTADDPASTGRAAAAPDAHDDPAFAGRAAAAFNAADALVASFTAAITKDLAPDRSARLYYERARLLEYPLGRVAEAESDYLTAAAGLDDHLPSLRGLRRCALRLGRPRDALEPLAREAALTPDPAARAALRVMSARVLGDLLGDAPAARAAWREAAALCPDATTLRGLARADLAAGDVAAHIATLERLSHVFIDDSALRAAVTVQRGRLLEAAADTPAAIALYQQALLLDPAAPGAAQALTRLLPPAGRWLELIAVLEGELEHLTEPPAAAVLLLEIAHVRERHLADPDGARRDLERAFALTPQSAPVLDELARHRQAAGHWLGLRDLLERRAHLEHDKGERVALWHRLARLCAGPLREPDAAVRWLQAGLSLDPTHGASLTLLGELLTAAGDWRGAIEAALREADAALAPEHRADACARAGDLAERHLADLPFAIAQHERALALQPDHAPSNAALDRLYVATGRLDALVALHERTAARAATPADAVAALFTVATVYETRLGAPQLAAAVYRRVLALAPERLDALHALQRVAARAGRPRDLLDALDLELDLARPGAAPPAAAPPDASTNASASAPPAAPTAARAAALELRAAVTLADALDAPERAIARARRALALDPGCWAAWTLLERLYRQLGRWADLLAALEAGLEIEPAGPAAITRLLELARVAGDELGRHDDAARYLERALAHAPGQRRVISALAEALARAGRPARQLEILALRLDTEADPATRAHAACALGELALGQGALEEAAQAYRAALVARPDWRPARDALARLATRPEAHAFVLATLETERARAATAERRRQLGHAAGQLALDRLGDHARAVTLYESLRDADPQDAAALLELERCARADGDPARVWAALDDLGRGGHPGLAAAALRDAAWLEVCYGFGDSAATLGRLVRFAPRDPEGLLALEQLALGRGDAALLEQVEAAALEADSAPASAHAGAAAGALNRERLVRLAELRDVTRPASAAAAWAGALAGDPESLTAAWGSVRAGRTLGDSALEARGLERVADLSVDADEVADALVARGQLAATALGDRAGAFDALDQALARAPDHRGAVAALEALARRPEEVSRALATLSRAARVATDPERVHALWQRVGQWSMDVLGQRTAAIEAFERALAARPDDGALWEQLGALYLRGAQYGEAARCLEAAAAHASDPATARTARRALAAVLTEHLGDPERARALLEAVVAEASEDVTAERALFEVHRSAGDLAGAVRVASALVGRLEAPEERAALQREIADLYMAQGDFSAAFAVQLELVAVEGPEGAAAAACRRALRTPADGEVYLAALMRWARAHPSAVNAPYQRELAQVRASVLGRPDEALRMLAEAVVARPEDLALQEVLVEALVTAGALAEAVEAAQNLVQVDVSRQASWQTLHLAAQAAGRDELALRALVPRVLSGQASAEERALVAQRVARPVMAPVGAGATLSPEQLRRIGDERPQTRPAERLLGALAEVVGRAFPERLDALRVSALPRLGQGDGHPLRVAAEAVARVFGVGSFELVLERDAAAQVRAVPGVPTTLIVPLALAEAAPAVRCHALARAFARVARGLEAFDLLDDMSLAVLVAAAERLVHPDVHAPAGVAAEAVEELSRRLMRLLPRRSRAHVDDCATEALREGVVDLRAWRRAIALTSARAALVVCDDLGAALLALSRDPQPGVDLARDALVFWVSDGAERARHELERGRAGGG